MDLQGVVERLGLRWSDYLVSLVLCALGEWTVWTALTVQGSRGLVAAGVLLAALALTARKRWPVPALLGVGVALVIPAALGSYVESLATVLMLVVAVFGCGRYGVPPLAYAGAPLGVAFALAGAAADPHETLASTWAWSLNSLWIFGVGLWLRQAHDLVVHTRQEQEAVARVAVAEERLRVAQDLHDVLAHSLSLMVVQAEVADEVLDTDAAAARRAIERVQRAGRSALAETRAVLGGLRSPDETAATRDLAGLLEEFRAAGLPVSFDGDLPCDLPPRTAHAAYRLLQEALTNVLRHAGRQPTRV
ncbi:MAG: sensor histidine kinase, partial [Nocardioidaceae bacterium]